jgi:hypothetical protein
VGSLVRDRAVISRCGRYRYLLERHDPARPDAPPLGFVMLNPSTADASLDDPTIRRCRGFAATLGYGGIVVLNLYALRATDPAELRVHPAPVGPRNDHWLRSAATRAPDIVCAWGNHADPARAAAAVSVLRSSGARLFTLGTTLSGAPRHPLYIRATQLLVPLGA